MSGKSTSIVASIIVAIAIATVAEAQFDVNPAARPARALTGKFQVAGFVGMQTIDQSLGSATNIYQTVTGQAENTSFGKLFGFRASWAFRPNLSVEFNFSRGTNAYTFVVDDDEIGRVDLGEQLDATNLNIGGNIVFEFPKGPFVPYITGGGGLQHTTPGGTISGVETVSTFDFNVGGGLKYWFTAPRWLGIRVDARYHSASDGLTFPGGSSSPKGLEFTVGASFKIL